MLKFVAKRLLSTLPVIFVVALIIFILSRLIPGDPAAILAGEFAGQDAVDEIRTKLGLDQPIWIQFWLWLGNIVTGDLGTSVFSDTPVSTLILQRVEPTLSLALFTLILALPTAIAIGIISAWYAERSIDRTLMLASVIGFSMPVFVVGFCLVYVFAMKLQVVPVQGYVSISQNFGGFFRTMILPATTLAIAYTALLSRITRTSILEVKEEDFNRTARAKGVSESGVMFRHTLRNAAIPILTIIGISLASLLSGSVVVENMFNIPGVGRLLLDSVAKRDYPVIQGIILSFSLLYVFINLMIDLLYAVVDPRINY